MCGFRCVEVVGARFTAPCRIVRQGVAFPPEQIPMKKSKRIPIDGEPIKWASPFAALKDASLLATSSTKPPPTQPVSPSAMSHKHRGRVDIIRQTAQRGGKTVTVVTGFTGIGQVEKETLAKQMQKACGAGGTVKEGRIEIQGDQRDTVARILAEAGFRPVFAGGWND